MYHEIWYDTSINIASPEGIVLAQARARRNISNANRAELECNSMSRRPAHAHTAPETNYHSHISSLEIDENLIDVSHTDKLR